MPILASKAAGSASGLGLTLDSEEQVYVEDVFSTYLLTETSQSMSVVNNIDLSGKGGMVWGKVRSGYVADHAIWDTVRGRSKNLIPNNTSAQTTSTSVQDLISFNSNGFTLGAGYNTPYLNGTGAQDVFWTFRKQPKFFDVVTWTGDGSGYRSISHNLGSVPGCIIIKCTSNVTNWATYHRYTGTGGVALNLNTSAASGQASTLNNGYVEVDPATTTSTSFDVVAGGGASIGRENVNASGYTYVAYLFAHNAGGFGLTGTDNVISCGSYTGNGAAGGQLINLGYEAQWVMIKRTNTTDNWWIMDIMRGYTVNGDFGGEPALFADLDQSESNQVMGQPSAQGFTPIQDNVNQSGQSYIYIAIRRGPMKVPTDATKVFTPLYEAGTGSARTVNAGFPIDLFFIKDGTGITGPTTGGNVFYDRLRGNSNVLQTQSAVGETASGTYTALFNSVQNGVVVSDYWSSYVYREFCFRRAPSFFDEVCYTGNNTNGRNITHNLGVVPELIIVKNRASSYGWTVYNAVDGYTYNLYLNTTAAKTTANQAWYATPTTTTFSVTNGTDVNTSSSDTYVAYLFATLAGVSKVGSYTGTGTTLQINCGFTAGARFVMIKRTDSTGDWYVWDTARGINAGDEGYLLLNSTAGQNNNFDYLDTYSAGFELSSTAPAGINANGGTYIFLAIA